MSDVPKLGRPNNRHTDFRRCLEVQHSPVDGQGCLMNGLGKTRLSHEGGNLELGADPSGKGPSGQLFSNAIALALRQCFQLGVRSGDSVGAALVAALSPPHNLANRSAPPQLDALPVGWVAAGGGRLQTGHGWRPGAFPNRYNLMWNSAPPSKPFASTGCLPI